MIIGHLPAGYLLGRAFSRLRFVEDVRPRDLVAASMLGSVFPDLDMIYFHLVDHGRTHHHLYWTHLPSIWIALSSAILFAGAVASRLRPPPAFWFFMLGVMSHLVLDSVIGDIYWAIPFNYEPFSMVTVQARHSSWYFNFILHWVFVLELALAVFAAAVACGDFRRYRARSHSLHW